MKGTRNRKELAFWIAGAILTLACFALGVNGVSGAGGGPPPCPPPCNCREITFWVTPNVPMVGVFQTGNAPTTDQTAILNVNTVEGPCQNSPLVGNGNCDRWQIPWGTSSCTPAPPNNNFPVELKVTQPQIGVVPGTQQNIIRNLCSP